MTPNEYFDAVGCTLIVTTVDGQKFIISDLSGLNRKSGWCYASKISKYRGDPNTAALVRIDNIVSVTVPTKEDHPVKLSLNERTNLDLALIKIEEGFEEEKLL